MFSPSVVSNSWRPQRGVCITPGFPGPSLSPRVCSNSCPLSQRCHPTILPSVALFACPQSFPASGFFPSESALYIRWPKYWSFSISPCSEYSGFISFRIYWFSLLAVQGTLKSLLQHHSSKPFILNAQLSLWLNTHIHT